MALTDQELQNVELHAEHAARAAEVLRKVRSLHEENVELRARLENQAGTIAVQNQIIGQAGVIIRSIEQIYKNPVATVQTNYEDFLPPELRQIHDRFVRGLL